MSWQNDLAILMSVLNYPLFELEGHPISISKLIFGIILLGLGFLISNRASRQIERRVLTRLNMDDHLRYTFRRFLYYFFLFLSVLFTLRTLHVPLTVFTVIGGALAVGIGFGSQNLVNNFISGLLVMMERPIRVGDYVEVDGIAGRVQAIGIRSTIVRTLANSIVVMPNTTFIEKNLTNWTLSGTVGSSVRFGVAYGTDPYALREKCYAVLRDIQGVLTEPAPGLMFVDFGDNALIFDLSYQVDAASFPARKALESEVRYRLNAMFTREKVDLPFPQRTVHLVGGSSPR